MDYVIAGVSGNTGSVVADTLLASGAKVRVIVRDEARGASWKARGAEVAVADLSDADAVAKALTGAKGAYLLIPPNMASPTPKAELAKVREALVAAVKKSAIPHVVFLSSIGAQHPAGTGPIASLHDAEKAFGQLAGTKFTFVRAAYFQENHGGSLGGLAHGVFPTFNDPGFAFDMVATKDIGLVAAKALREGATGNSIIELTGPRRYSANDIAASLTEITGKPVAVAPAPLATMATTLVGYGFQPELAGMYQEMTGALESGHVAHEGTHRSVKGSIEVSTTLRALLAPKP